jgi:hypothetical protein
MFKRKSKNNAVPLGTIPRRRYGGDVADRNEHAAPDNQNLTHEQTAFRRNRNLASGVGIAALANTPSARVSAHQLRRRRRKIVLSLIAMLGIAAMIFILLTQSIFVTHIALYGQMSPLSPSDQQRYAEVAQQYFNQHPLQRLRGLISLDKLAGFYASSGHAEIKSVVELQPTSLGAAQLTLKAREPIASWTSDGVTRYVDSDGAVFSKNYYTKPPIRIVDQSNISVSSDTGAIASSRLLQFIGLASGEMKSYGYHITQINLPANTTRQVELVLDSKQRIKMTIDRPAGQQCEDASRALSYFAKHRERIKYIDVRVSREAYYK